MTFRHHWHPFAYSRYSKLIILGSILLVLTIALGAASVAATRSPVKNNLQVPEHAEQDQETVVVRTADEDQVKATAQKKGVEVLEEVPLPSGESLITLEGSENSAKVQQLEQQTKTDAVPSYTYKALATPNDPNFGDQWNFAKVNAPAAWDISTGSQNSKLAVIDSGVLFDQSWGSQGPFTQPDFPEADKMWVNTGETGTTADGDACWTGTTEDKSTNNCDDDGSGYNDDWRGWDFMGGFRGPDEGCPNFNDPSTYESSDPNFLSQDNDPQPYSCDSPTHPTELNKTHYDSSIGCEAFTSACYVGHGTMAASVAGAATNNSTLVAGADWQTQIMNVRALDGYGFGSSGRIAAAIEYATAMEADVINLSLAIFDGSGSCTTTDSTVELALQAAHDAGIVVVAAAGNTGTSGVCYPARSDNAIAVGASNSQDERSGFSSYGPEVDLIAPGSSVPVANAPSDAAPGNFRSSVNGTSFAAPHVAGVASLVKNMFAGMSPQQVRKVISYNADRVSDMGSTLQTHQHGRGRLNMHETLNVQNSGAYGGIRLIECNGENYLVERNIRRKRAITDAAMQEWNLQGMHFSVADSGCDYPTYELPLDRVVRSRDTGREYFVIDDAARYINSKDAADSWGVYDYQSTTYPQMDGWNIHFLEVRGTIPTHSPDMGSSNIRLFKCDGQEYMVERFVRRKRPITATALETWGLSDAYFPPQDHGCTYPSFSVSLDRVIRSRDTGREYLTDRTNAYQIQDQRIATAWGLGDVSNTTYPQFYGESIHFLTVQYELPQLGQSSETDQVYVADSGNRYHVTGTGSGDTRSLQLIRGYDEVPMATVSPDLLNTLTDSGSLDYAFQIGSDWYVLDHNRTRRIHDDDVSRWEHFITGPTLSSDVLQMFADNDSIGHGWQRDEYYYRITTDGNLQRTTDESLAESWGVTDTPVMTHLLTNKLINELGVEEQ